MKSGRIAVAGLAVVASIVAAVAITGVMAGESSRRFPDNYPGTFWLRQMTDIDTGSDGNRLLMLWTSNRRGRATKFEFSSDRLTMQDFIMNMHPAHLEHWDAALGV